MGGIRIHRFVFKYDYVAYSLGVIDGILFIISAIQLLRIILHERHQQKQKEQQTVGQENGKRSSDENRSPPRRNWSGKKSFHAIITCCLLVRSTFFCFQPAYIDGHIRIPPSLEIIWQQFGTILFVLAYFMLLVFWAQFYYQVDGSSKRKKNKKVKVPLTCIFIISAILFGIFSTLSVLWVQKDRDVEDMDEISSGILALVTVAVALGFMYYGVKLFILLRRYRLLSSRKRVQTRKVVGVAILCTFAFLTRAALVFETEYQAWQHYDKGFNAAWEIVVLFFFGLETLPIALMMFLLRKLPSWKTDPATKSLIQNP